MNQVLKFSKSKFLFTTLFVFLTLSRQSHADLPAGYQNQMSEVKLSVLWENNILSTAYQALPPIKNPGLSEITGLLNPIFLSRSFSHSGDEIPRGRIKLIHTYGSVAQIEFIPTHDTPFTGIFKTGAVGLARISLAADPTPPASFTPGLAIKFLVDGRASKNIHVMNSLEGQGANQNIFALAFTNYLPTPKSLKTTLLAWIFSVVKYNPGHLSVEHLAGVDRYGHGVGDRPLWPRIIYFKPTAEVQMDPKSTQDFRINLSHIPSGTTLYEVWGYPCEGSNLGRPEVARLIGKLVTRSPFVASKYGDKNLFFQHNGTPGQ